MSSQPEKDRCSAAVWANDEPFRTCVDSLLDPLSIWTAVRAEDGRIVDFAVSYVNDAAVRAAGLPREQLVGRTVGPLLPEAEREGRLARLRHIVASGEPYRGHETAYESALLGPPGPRWYDCQVVRLGDGVLITWRDVTEQRETEAALAASEERYRRQAEELDTIWQTAPVGLSIVDRDLVIHKMNERLAELNGVPIEEALGCPGPALSPTVSRNVAPLVRAVFESGRAIVGVEVSGAAAPDAPPVHWLCSYAPLTDEAGEVEAVSCVVQDITEYKRAVLELEEARNTLEQRVAERTAALGARAAQLRELAAQLADTEQRERRRLAEMLHDEVQQFLVAARMQLTSLRPRLPDRAGAVVEESAGLIARAIQVSRSLSSELRPPVLYEAGIGPAVRWLAEQFAERHDLRVAVQGDLDLEGGDDRMRALLYEATRELLRNVVRHAGVHTARVHLQRLPDGRAAVRVEDDGCGFRPGALTRSGRKGGLGLFAIRERLEALGGRVEIESPPAGGTRVTLQAPQQATTPEVPAATGEIQAACAPTPSDGRVRVLVVDDHPIVREGITQRLAMEPDFEVAGEAEDGPTAVQAARRLRPDVILMDVNLPRMNGIEATRAIVRELPRTAIIGLSIHDDASTAAAMAEAGALEYLTKDGPIGRLVDTVRRLGRGAN